MTVSVDVRHRLGSFALAAAFESGGPLTALFGHSGSGKTTLVNLIGGLQRPGEGRIAVDGRTVAPLALGGSFFASAHCEASYRAHVARLLARTNGVTGARYSEDPTILAWELINEAEAAGASGERAIVNIALEAKRAAADHGAGRGTVKPVARSAARRGSLLRSSSRACSSDQRRAKCAFSAAANRPAV